MKLEKGMYIRFEGEISKIGWISSQTCEGNKTIEARVHTKNGLCLIFPNDKFKASHNIIDLIEVGDYINGSLVSDITGEYLRADGESHNKHYLSKYIKSIVTKEQFESVSYKIN